MNRFLGDNGSFVWFLATVTNINDPDKLGQCQIRIDNFHDQYDDEDLPWAMSLLPTTSASYQTEEYGEVGTSPTGILKGSHVLGFFADGKATRVPIIMGTLPAIKENDINKHDVPKEAREINTWQSKKLMGPEPAPAYGAKYPFNKVKRTLSGHVIEIDDTPNAERIHIYHKSGTYMEIDHEGRTVTKINSNNYTIVAKDNQIYIEGNESQRVKGDLNINVNGNISINCQGIIDINANGDATISSSSKIELKAPKINILEGQVDVFRNQ